MPTAYQELSAQFQSLSNESLLQQASSGELTEQAQSAANTEVLLRGLSLPSAFASEPAEEYLGDMQIVVRHLDPTEAHLLCAALQTCGIPADMGDTHLVQANALLTQAVGGACVRVPSSLVGQATEAIAAYNRGDFQLDDDFDVGQEAPDDTFKPLA